MPVEAASCRFGICRVVLPACREGEPAHIAQTRQDAASTITRNSFDFPLPPASNILEWRGEKVPVPFSRLPPICRCLQPGTALVDEYLPRVYRFALRLTGSREEAEDLTQETFLRAWRRRGHLRDPARARVWLFTIAKNLWNDRLRRKARRPAAIEPLPEDQASTAAPADRELMVQEDLRRVLAAMDSLPARQREVLYLRACEEMSISEIGAVLGISVEAAKASLCEARKRLRERFSEIDCERKKGTGTFCAKHPPGRSSIRCLSPFPAQREDFP